MSESVVMAPAVNQSMVSIRLSDVQLFPEMIDLPRSPSPRSSILSRSSQATSISDTDTSSFRSVNWESLERTEEEETKNVETDEATALLLAQLESQNAVLAEDPKANLHKNEQSITRPPSIYQLKSMVTGPQRPSLRYSLLPAPPMTELEFWAALVADYAQTAQRLPTLTSNKIRGGVPPPLRGVVWPSIAGARDAHLHEEYRRLVAEKSPYEGLIAKDVGRSFPTLDMFKERDGDGQRMLGNVLKAFSLHDDRIGYCQGLGFVVGPLLLHMSDVEAFSILVRLMEHYDIRSCYLPDLAGLHLRIFQYQALLTRHLPDLAAHLASLKIEPLYVSQWFLSFFAVTCPLPMLLRIYDVILAEGATETLMRVALSLMERNEKKLKSLTEFEDAMQFLLSRSLWDTYAQHADDLIHRLGPLTCLVSPESLQNLEKDFTVSKSLVPPTSLRSTASTFLGRFWAGSAHSISKSASNLSLVIPGGRLRSLSNATSLTSTVNSLETISDVSTAATEVTDQRPKSESAPPAPDRSSDSHQSHDKDLHHQIEELLTALNNLQHQQTEMAKELQKEKDERAEDREISKSLFSSLRTQSSAILELAGGEKSSDDEVVETLLSQAEQHFITPASKRISIVASKRQLRDNAVEWKEKYEIENTRCQDLMRQLDERDKEQTQLQDTLREARHRIQDAHREKQKLERSVADLRARKQSLPDSPSDLYTPVSETPSDRSFSPGPARGGLRELRLGRPEAIIPSATFPPTTTSSNSTIFAKRSSSLNTQAIPIHTSPDPSSDDTLLLELATAKTAEAVARQELEETRAKLDALRRIVSGTVTSPRLPKGRSMNPSASPFGIVGATGNGIVAAQESNMTSPSSPGSETGSVHTAEKALPGVPDSAAISTPQSKPIAVGGGGFFSGWGRRGP